MQRADVAMYDAKASSTTRIEIYKADRDANSPRRLALTNDLRDAIESEDLALHYQPKAMLSDGSIGSVEALIRWRHPVYGNVPPDDFVPLAERTGLIHPFTDFVVREGVDQLHRWSARGIDIAMSINLSMRNLLDTTLPDRVADTISTIGVEPRRITFEVTESSMMADPAKTLSVLHGLARLGVRLSIDDFGTGHSSLAYLQRLPVHEVKIDKSFVMPITSDHSSRAIVQSIIQLAHNLGLTVVAEGVEDVDTWDELCELGCDEAQGYFLCRPVPPLELLEWMDTRASINRR
jgi:EAL domain-containing protein (putative c-di-GMP-specific phosphodiesterase class I)